MFACDSFDNCGYYDIINVDTGLLSISTRSTNMELNIGANIKKLRLDKGLTQEQLANILGISTAAVSKWEAKNTYPDITMLIPLAQIFNVSLDDLMRYDETKVQEEITVVLRDYKRLCIEGKNREASALIMQARQKYPNDFRIMSKYILDISRSFQSLQDNQSEILVLCDSILNNCTQDKLRHVAIQVKAKVLHTCGDTESAIELLSSLPKAQAALATEQIFSKGSAEYRTWNRKNCYSLLNIMAIKHARTIQYDPNIAPSEKIGKLTEIAENYAKFGENEHCAFMCIAEEAVYWIAADLIMKSDSDIHEIIKAQEAHLYAMHKIEKLSKSDLTLQELLIETYGTKNLIKHQISILKTSPYPQYVAPRNDPEYTEMLNRWDR